MVKNLPTNAGDPGSRLGKSPGEGNGYPLQYSCLENPRDREVCKATVHGVGKSQTRLRAHMRVHTGHPDLLCTPLGSLMILPSGLIFDAVCFLLNVWPFHGLQVWKRILYRSVAPFTLSFLTICVFMSWQLVSA